jgi:hypothetical protein
MKAQARHAHNYGHKFMNVTVHYLNVNLLQGNRRFPPSSLTPQEIASSHMAVTNSFVSNNVVIYIYSYMVCGIY